MKEIRIYFLHDELAGSFRSSGAKSLPFLVSVAKAEDILNHLYKDHVFALPELV